MKTSPVLSVLAVALSLDSAIAAPPSNDSFANAIQLSGNVDTETGSQVDATREGSERSETGHSTVWYKWAPPSSGRARFAALPGTGDSNRYLQISVWFGTAIENLSLLGSVWDFDGEAAISNLPVHGGSQYFICVGRDTSSTTFQGPFSCSVVLQTNSDLSARNVVAASGSDFLFQNATQLSGVSATAISYSLDAVAREAGEPVWNPSYSSWWRWTAPANGYARVSLAGSEIGAHYRELRDKSMLAYQVDSFQEMAVATPIAMTQAGAYLPGDMNFRVSAGETYYIAAGAGRYDEGVFRGGSQDAMNWKVLTVQYSANSPAVEAAKAAINAQIAGTKKAMKRAKTAKAKKSLRKRLTTLLRQLRAL